MFERLTSWENLMLAYRKASLGKRGQAGVAEFEHRLEENVFDLMEELTSGDYAPGPYRSFPIHEPKRRLISAAPFRDRVVHHALCNVIEPIFEASFVADSFANRVGKGTHRALERCQRLARRHAFVLSCDVREFFPSVDHEILRGILERKIVDGRVLALADRVLHGGRGVLDDEYTMEYFPGDDLLAPLRPRGLPIGNLTSQFWANVYLSPFDHFVKRTLRCPGYVRYVDDFLLFADDKATLWRWKGEVERWLERLRLKIHAGAHPRPVTEGVAFLGWIVRPGRRRLKRRKAVHFRRRLRAMRRDVAEGRAGPDELDAMIEGWTNHVRYGNTVGLRRAVLGDRA